jgi:hypothetical protein
LIANQIAIATIATTIIPHITGVTCFVLPLRGESLAAWLNSCFMERAFRQSLVVQTHGKRESIETPP